MITLWHNPRCSKSRETLALLQEAGAEVEIRAYLQDPPTRAEIEAALTALDLPASALVRRGEKLFRDLGLSPQDPPERLVEAMAAHPILIERPVAFRGNRAVIGRPPDAVRTLL